MVILRRLLHSETGGGVVLLLAAVAALLWANSPAGEGYVHFWHLPLFSQSLHFWVNDGLMTIFFLAVGLEIRRELHDGALTGLRRAALPVAAAMGGVIMPALIYMAFNGPMLDTEPLLARGWAIPTATDIAFAVGVLALLGPRFPPALRVLLLAIAIIDDIIAILIIAFFYSEGIAPGGLAITAAGLAGVLLMRRLGVRQPWFYVAPGAVVWFGLLQAGVHPTLSGVILGLLTPVAPVGVEETPPVLRVQQALHPWVTFGIMPLFALANAGVALGAVTLDAEAMRTVMIGVMTGLVVGKPVGILVVTALTVRLGWCSLPPGATLKGMLIIGCMAGIGFTMAIFIAALAFTGPLLETAKLSILLGSTVAAVLGLALGLWLRPKPLL